MINMKYKTEKHIALINNTQVISSQMEIIYW